MEIAFVFILIHTVADFIFQAEEWATNKNHSIPMLLKHTATYSLVTMVLLGIIMPGLHPDESIAWHAVTAFMFGLITFVFHTITDFFSSKIVSRKFANKEFGSPIPNLGAFTMIQFDQVLHYGQLFLTYYLLTL